MSWLKLGRWVCLGSMGVLSAAACGGRGSLPEEPLEGDAGESSFGATAGVGGTKGNGGKGGTAGVAGKGGTAGMAGVAGVAGTGGGPAVCKPGTTLCRNNGVAACTAAGMVGPVKPCAAGQTCLESAGKANCVAQVCKPGQTQCDVSGALVERCSADGASLSTVTDCSARGQRCVGGACQSLMCQPNQAFCDKNTLRLCAPDGKDSALLLTCASDSYCDAASFSCQPGLCSPSQPACNGTVATTCNANGSGYLAGGTNCSLMPDRQCVFGKCLCAPNLADCDGLSRNGCEIDVGQDPDNCSTCGVSCSSNHVSVRSCNGACNGTCEAGYEDCNGDKLKDGCETSIANNRDSCGACGATCSTNHISPSCTNGVCDGKCTGTFADCNGDKLKDGCETDLQTDAASCGGCGLTCSSNHIKPQCSNGACNGTCAKGFEDCNGNRQVDGCETDILDDAANCGKCGLTCADGESCTNGSCGSLLTFSGIAQNLSTALMTGWTQCYSEAYGQSVTPIADVQKACSGSLVMLACRAKGSSSLQLAAYAPRADVFFDTGGAGNDTPHDANGVGWYYNTKYSWGFAPQGAVIERSSCDIQDSTIKTGTDGDRRLCWHTQENKIAGGWRCGRNDNLNADTTYERLMFTAQ